MSEITIGPSFFMTYGTVPTVISGHLEPDSGQPTPTGEIVHVTLNGVTQDATIDDAGDFATAFDASKLSVSTSSNPSYPIKAAYDGDPHNSSASGSSSLLVLPAITSFSNLSLSSSTITYGTASVTLSGHLNSDSDQPVPAGETVSISAVGQTLKCTLDGNDDFTCTADTHALPVIPSPPNSSQSNDLSYPILVSYDGDGNFASAHDASLSLTVTPDTPSFSNLSAPTITYGTNLTTVTGHLDANAGQQPVPAGETVLVTLNNGISQIPFAAELDANDDFSATFDTSQLNVLHSPYTIDFSYVPFLFDNNFNSATASSSLTVVPATPTFAPLGSTFGTGTVTITGFLNANAGLQLVPAGESVTVTLNGVQQTAGLDSSDNFSTSFDTSQLNAANSPYPITFSYDAFSNGDKNFTGTIASSTLNVTVIASAPVNPAGISPLTPQQQLARDQRTLNKDLTKTTIDFTIDFILTFDALALATGAGAPAILAASVPFLEALSHGMEISSLPEDIVTIIAQTNQGVSQIEQGQFGVGLESLGKAGLSIVGYYERKAAFSLLNDAIKVSDDIDKIDLDEIAVAFPSQQTSPFVPFGTELQDFLAASH